MANTEGHSKEIAASLEKNLKESLKVLLNEFLKYGRNNSERNFRRNSNIVV